MTLSTPLQIEVLRLQTGDDLRGLTGGCSYGPGCWVCTGGLRAAALRYADQPQGTALAGALEPLALSGTLSADGPHLHGSVADALGQVRGGHVMPGCVVRTMAEIVLADAETDFPELVAHRVDGAAFL